MATSDEPRQNKSHPYFKLPKENNDQQSDADRQSTDRASRPRKTQDAGTSAEPLHVQESGDAANDGDTDVASGEEVTDRAVSIAAQRPG